MRDHGWGPPGRHGRPPWWPEDEPFPPRPGQGWQGPPRRVVRRFVVAVVAFLLLVVAVAATVVALLGRALADDGRTGGSALVAALLLVVVVLVATRAARRWASPIGEVMQAAEAVAVGDLSARVRPRGPWAVRRLGGTFNTMVERLETDETRRRELLADLAHELRTPLTGIRGTVEAMQDGIRPLDADGLDVVLARADVMQRLLDDLQLLSTAEAGALRLHPEPTPPGRLVEDVVAAHVGAARGAGLELAPEVAPGLPALPVDPVRIGQVLSNLVTNALRHTPSGGRVVISAVAEDDAVVLAVADDGPGIPDDEQDRVFDRFARSADSGGIGLGLAIVRSLAAAHGGTVELHSTAAGTTVRVRLPLSS